MLKEAKKTQSWQDLSSEIDEMIEATKNPDDEFFQVEDEFIFEPTWEV